MVELAIILPILLLLLFGITELGRALYQQNILTQAVELGGRYMARVEGAVNEDSCEVGENWENAVIMAKNLITCGVDSGCSDSVLPNISFDENSFAVSTETSISAAGTSVSACVITVRAEAPFVSIFGENLVPVPGFNIGSVTLNAETRERYTGH
ncbi:MAG: TadE/TadG family type IV pilus assembly protein [Thiomicrorhabdus sp.]|nr:TadE/TadG family type IV pilus assembly protein [Thiomicrorhabdus sp.]